MKTYKQLQERINMARAKMGDVIKDFQQSDAPQFKGKSQEKRRQMAIAAKMAAEEVELEEGRMKEIALDINSMGDKEFKAKHKKSKQEMKDALSSKPTNEEVEQVVEGIVSDIKRGSEANTRKWNELGKGLRSKTSKEEGRHARASNRYASIAAGKGPFGKGPLKKANEEVEQIDEISTNLAIRARSKALSDTSGKDRSKLSKLALDKWTGKAKVGSGKYNTNEEVEQIEESDLKPFIVVHAKHGKFETHAASTYEAAKNAAAHWKTKKGTAGMDVHRADITHSTQHVG